MGRVSPAWRRFLPNLICAVLGAVSLAIAAVVYQLLWCSVVLFALAVALGTDREGRYRLLALPRLLFFALGVSAVLCILVVSITMDIGFIGFALVVAGAIVLFVLIAETVLSAFLRLLYRLIRKQKFGTADVSRAEWILFGVCVVLTVALAVVWMMLV